MSSGPFKNVSKKFLQIIYLIYIGLDMFGSMANQPLWVVLYQIHFYTYKQFYFKQFSFV